MLWTTQPKFGRPSRICLSRQRCIPCAPLPTSLGEFQILSGPRPQFRGYDNSIAIRCRPLQSNLTLAVLELKDSSFGTIEKVLRLLFMGRVAHIGPGIETPGKPVNKIAAPLVNSKLRR